MKIRQEWVPNRQWARKTEKSSPQDQVTTYVCDEPQHRGLIEDVRACLSDDLRKPRYQGDPNPMAGHCYVVSEVMYHKLGGKAEGWVPQTVQHEGGPHWYMKNKETGVVLDLSADQFETPVPYDQGRGCGFLTRQPSKRSQTVMDRLDRLA